MPRIIEPASLPVELWDPSHPPTAKCKEAGCISLPATFSSAYTKLLDELSLKERACADEEDTNGGAVGGAEDGAFEEHFARRFSGSAARVLLYFIDPRNAYATASDTMLALFAGGQIRILDIPFGAGAASAVLLTVIAELRNKGLLPRNPTTIVVTGGDIDNAALRAGRRLFAELSTYWQNAGLAVTANLMQWDAASDESTSDLVSEWQRNIQPTDRCATIVANFSGYLCEHIEAHKCRRYEQYDYSIRSILVGTARAGGSVFWIEPNRKRVPEMFRWLQESLVANYRRLQAAHAGGHRSSLSTTRSPLAFDSYFTARCAAFHWKGSSS